ncbi:hypothetical protein PV646_28550 [Streptomyces sp. ID05-26A]|nr:hypothetical protein [Streptomyces sp. ID05-26A]
MTSMTDGIEPQIGGEVDIRTSGWPGGVEHVWLRVDDYAGATRAEVVLTAKEAVRVSARTLAAALFVALPAPVQRRLSDLRAKVQEQQSRGGHRRG